ncbi:MAG: hypothetical protein JNL13_09805 [Chitinophagaceae bacterium]|nr:hypothetical protein [Chitinophagaceae bacterium]
MSIRKIALLPLIACFYVNSVAAQSVSYSPLFDNTTFSRSIDLSKPVGAIDGAAGTSPSGAATYTIPIKTPPGTRGMAPQLSIVYNSQGGNGILGQGWSLSGLSVITRAGKDFYHDGKVTPVAYTNDDAFILDGQRLVTTSGSNGAPGTTYRTEAESYSVITSNETIGEGPRYFNVVSKDGTLMQYGYTDDARFVNDDDSRIMMWRLNKIQDVNGNYISFHYDNSDRESRISQIKYTGNVNTGLAPYLEINFVYGIRDDKNALYDGGYSVQSKHLLWQIQIKDATEIFKTYQFSFGKKKVSNSYLKYVQEFAQDGSSLNDLRFKYGEESTEFTISSTSITTPIPTSAYGVGEVYLSAGDYDGNGSNEIVTNTLYHWPASMSGGGDHWESKGYSTTGYGALSYYSADLYSTTGMKGIAYTKDWQSSLSLSSKVSRKAAYSNISFSDFNGDEKEDILSYSITASGELDKMSIYYPTGTGAFAFSETDVAPIYKPAYYSDNRFVPNHFVIQGDFDGDMATDFITIIKDIHNKYLPLVSFPRISEMNKFITAEGASYEPFDSKGQEISEADQVLVLDFDGDGKSELLVVKGGLSKIYRFKKEWHGGYALLNVYSDGDVAGTKYDELRVGDFNGDGKSDLFSRKTVAGMPTFLIMYSSGLGFVNCGFWPEVFNSSCPYGKNDQFYIGDFNADGKSDIFLFRRDCSSAGSYATHSYLDMYFFRGATGAAASSYTPEYKSQEYSAVPNNDIAPLIMDANGDGIVDFCFQSSASSYLQVLSFETNAKHTLLSSVTDGFNRTTEFIYDPLSKGGDIYTKGSGAVYPVNNVQYPIYVVTSLKTPDGIGGISTTAFRYENLRLHRAGRGLLGFEKTRTINFTTGFETQTQYALNTDFYVPYLKSSKTFLSRDPSVYSLSTNNYSFTRIGSGYCFTQTNPSGSSEDLLSGTTSSYSHTYDADGNITNSTSTLNGDVTITTTTATSYTKVAGSPFFNAPAEITVTTQRDSKPSVDKTTMEYDASGRLIESYTMPDGITDVTKRLTKFWEYDHYGNKTVERSWVLGFAYTPYTKYEYDAQGRFVTKEINKLGDYTAYSTHKFWGKPLSVTGISGLTSTNTYDAWGKLRAASVPVSSSVSYTINYSDGWDPGTHQLYYTLVQDPSAPDVKSWYDQLGREVKTQQEHSGGAWTHAWTRYDARGNVQEKSNSYLSAETPLTLVYAYDERNRLKSETTPTGTTKYEYSFSGGLAFTKITLPDGKIKKSKTDASGKLLESDNGIAGAVIFDYDSRGNELWARMKVFSSGMTFINKAYDQWGRLVQMDDADAGKTTYQYNPFGQLTEQKDAKGKTTHFRYETDFGRLREKELDGVITTYTYYDKLKGYQLQQESVTSTKYGTITDAYDYTDAGKLALHTKNTNGVLVAKTFAYDGYGRPLVTEYASGLGIRNHYDTYGFLQKITTNFAGGGAADQVLYQAHERRGDGQIKKFTRSNGLATEYTYEYGTLTRMQDLSGIYDLAMGYEFTNGNLYARGDIRAGNQEFFSYDAADRLTSSQAEKTDGSASWPTISVQYDVPSPYWTGSYGRIVSKSDAGTYGYRSIPRNAVATITDPGGLVSHATQDITYTPFHKADKISETISGTAFEENFVYDAGEDRAYSGQVQGGVVTHQRWYMGDYERDEVTGSAEQQIHYISGEGGLCAIVVKEGGSFTYYTAYTDHLGSIVLLTDDAGTPLYRQAYDPWGRERDPETWDHGSGRGTKPRWLTRGYTGHEMLPEYGLINMNGRLYDPLNGRMLRPDNYVQDPTNTQSYNRFSYCWNNPMKYTDPSGELVWFVPLIYAGVNLAFDLAMKDGKMDFGQIATSLITGAVGGALGGATSFSAAVGGAMISQMNRFLPSIPLIQSQNFNLSASPMFGMGSSGFNFGGSFNASGMIGNFAYSASVSAGYNSGMSSLGEAAGGSGYVSGGGFAGYNAGNANYGLGYSYSSFGGKTAQGVGAVTAQIGDFGIRIDEDFGIGDGGDRYRTGGLLATYRINNDLTLAFGGSMMTGNAIKNGESPIDYCPTCGPNGTWNNEDIKIRGGTMYGGVIYKGQGYYYGNNSEKRLHTIQNSIHGSKMLNLGTPYFRDLQYKSKAYSYYGSYNHSYLNY